MKAKIRGVEIECDVGEMVEFVRKLGEQLGVSEIVEEFLPQNEVSVPQSEVSVPQNEAKAVEMWLEDEPVPVEPKEAPARSFDVYLSRNCKGWTDEEMGKLAFMISMRKPMKEMCEALGRSVGAIQQRANKLGLSVRGLVKRKHNVTPHYSVEALAKKKAMRAEMNARAKIIKLQTGCSWFDALRQVKKP